MFFGCCEAADQFLQHFKPMDNSASGASGQAQNQHNHDDEEEENPQPMSISKVDLYTESKLKNEQPQ